MNYEHGHKFDLFLVRILHESIILNITREELTPAIWLYARLFSIVTYIVATLLEPTDEQNKMVKINRCTGEKKTHHP